MIGFFKECVTTEYWSLFPVNTFKKMEWKKINLWLLSIMLKRPVTDQWGYPSKIERHFLIKPWQPTGMALTIFSPLQNSLVRVKNQFVKNGAENFGRIIPTQISDLLQRYGDPEFSGQKKAKQIFPVEFRPNFQESLPQWKSPCIYPHIRMEKKTQFKGRTTCFLMDT